MRVQPLAGEQQCKPGQPAQAGSEKKEVQEAQPDSGNPVNRNHQPIGEAEAEQGGHHEAEGHHEDRIPQRHSRSEAEIAHEDDEGAIDEPMSKTQNGLHREDGEDGPGLQTEAPCFNDYTNRGQGSGVRDQGKRDSMKECSHGC